MKVTLGLILIALAQAQFWYYGYNIFTLMFLILLTFVGVLLTSVAGRYVRYDRERDSDNLATLAAIERNRYFRKPE